MFISEHNDFKSSGLLNALVQDYLNKDKRLNKYFSHFPDKTGFEKVMHSNPYSQLDRNLLFEIVQSQSGKVNNSSKPCLDNISKLKQKNTFVVTTGHQLCLFTGPLYFIYKIFSAINLAEELKNQFPEYEFVPVYWMASEDHDFEEVNHFHVFGKKIFWESSQTGAVGDFSTSDLKSVYPTLQEIFGQNNSSEILLKLFERSYLQHNNLSDATRYLVNELFGEYGLVTIDGHDPAFKKQFVELFKDDIFNHSAHKKVSETIEELKKLGYEAQVNPRLINCFYIEKNLRNRIELVNGRYQVTGTSLSFSKDEMERIISNHPEKLSPNVVTRPLYQQAILPNIAYVGGPGELAYWLEYKAMFDYYNFFFPILIPRNFITVVEKKMHEKIKKLKSAASDYYKDETTLVNEFMERSGATFELKEEKQQLTHLYSQIQEKVNAIDKSLAGSVSAELQKSLNGLEAILAKTNKALKIRSETEINQIKSIKQKLFPGGIPQERYENFSYFYLIYGPGFLKEIKKHIQPFSIDSKILFEN